ncbi:hypothetical protein BMG03_19240 (plasmid) [Thioclava nitratireducens]|uniref:Transcriptional regulator n=1 Tax=Thioclava nitratireducens TaxID=1915078 RepID=A0ABM6IML5_9RHOB|nr:hypothetical protein [Thioclava nitratireducens]AQS50061.1 hypothetical protein BMG03_19240 [Thioclava nitratireducens]
MKNFRDKMLEVRPEIAEREAEFPDKIDLAMELRALRDAADLSPEQVATLSELSLEDVQTCESLTGEMPEPDLVAAYRSAINKHSSLQT